MNYPLRQNLEVYAGQIRCTQCRRVLCRSSENWKDACIRSLSPPTQAGPLMKELAGHFVLEQLYCPGCGALFNTDLVEEKKNGEQNRAEPAKA
jgi:hypothetical protein